MQSTPRPQRKAAVAGEFKRATAGVPDRDSRPTKPQQAPKEPAVLHAPVEAPSKPPMYRAGRHKHVAHLTQLAQVAPVNVLPVRVKKQPRLCA